MSEKLLAHHAALTNIIRRVAAQAGDILLEYFDGIRDMAPTRKQDGSPVTQADTQAERFIEEKLKDITPGIPVIGEEAYSDGYRPDLSAQDYFWLVDPLDGTRAFVMGKENFTTNIALIHRSRPALGVVYAPQKEEMYYGYYNDETKEGQAFRCFGEAGKEKRMKVRTVPGRGMTVMTSGDHAEHDSHKKFLQHYKVAGIVRRASSLKICAIANGKADIYIRFGPTGEWDTAAGHAILRAAGGDICDMAGHSLYYGRTAGTLINPDFIAASGDVFSCIKQAEQEK